MTGIGKKRPAPARSHYQTLQVRPADSKEVIHAQYKLLAQLHHPDAGGDAEKFKEISLAWGVLKDEKMRKDYDVKMFLEGRVCKHCGGHGTAWSFRKPNNECPTCKGTGELNV